MGLTSNSEICKIANFRVQLPSDAIFYNILTAFLFVPTLIFLAVISTSFVVNVGFALVLQGVTLILCLAWFVPTTIFCFAAAYFLTKVANCTIFLLNELEKRKVVDSTKFSDDTLTTPKAHEKLL